MKKGKNGEETIMSKQPRTEAMDDFEALLKALQSNCDEVRAAAKAVTAQFRQVPEVTKH